MKHLAIIGVGGMMGGSIALAASRSRKYNILGYDKNPKNIPAAIWSSRSLKNVVSAADIIVLAVPIQETVPMLKKVMKHCKRDALIVDIASAKADICEEIQHIRGAHCHFVPCHPMAGKEKSTAKYADKDLFNKRWAFLTPMKYNSQELVDKAHDFWNSLGSETYVINPYEHDSVVGFTSHTPHIIASAYMLMFGARIQMHGAKQAAGTGFSSFTRIAAANPNMWANIVSTNPAVINPLHELIVRLVRVEDMIIRKDKRGLIKFFSDAKKMRDQLE